MKIIKIIGINLVVVISLGLSGCGGALGGLERDMESSISSSDRVNSTKTVNKKYTLSIITQPKDTSISIIDSNIRKVYKENMQLKKGMYKIEISKNGYNKYQKLIDLNKDIVLDIKLAKKFLANGNFEWSNKVDYLPNELKQFGNLYWQDDKNNLNNIVGAKAAKQYCKNYNYSIEGIDLIIDFRLPTKHEFENNYWLNVKKIENRRYHSLNGGRTRQETFWTSDFIMSKPRWKSSLGKKIIEKDYDIYCRTFYRWKHWNYGCRGESPKSYKYKRNQHNIRCVADAEAFNKINVDTLTNVLFVKQLKIQSKLILPQKPVKKVYIQDRKYIKGEFETKKAFIKRVELEKSKTRKLNELIDKEYDKSLKQWKKKMLQEKKIHQRLLTQIEKEKNQLYIDAYRKAFHIKYGKAVINTINYDADNQRFAINIKSERGGYNYNVNIPVKINHAKKIKALLTDSDYTPTIKFKIVNSELKFQEIKEVKEAVKMLDYMAKIKR